MKGLYSVEVRKTAYWSDTAHLTDNRGVEIVFTEKTGRKSSNSNVQRVTRELAAELRDKLDDFLNAQDVPPPPVVHEAIARLEGNRRSRTTSADKDNSD